MAFVLPFLSGILTGVTSGVPATAPIAATTAGAAGIKTGAVAAGIGKAAVGPAISAGITAASGGFDTPKLPELNVPPNTQGERIRRRQGIPSTILTPIGPRRAGERTSTPTLLGRGGTKLGPG